MEVDGCLVVLPISVSTGHHLDHLDFAVDPLRRCICDPVLDVSQKVCKVPFQCLCGLDHRRKP